MKTNLTMEDFKLEFKKAIAENYKWFAVTVHIPGFPKDEVIINPWENAQEKLDYYTKAYDENMTHRQSGVVRIVDFDYADFIDELKFFDSKG